MKEYKANEIFLEIKKVIKGKDDIIKKVLAAILAKGHILLEDIPGVGKTTLALAFSKALELEEKRLQFTPDVLPADITGYYIFDKKIRDFVFREGGVMCNLFLADEINRTSPKTQSALLEVMEEGKVTVDGKTYEIPKPFFVIATQNPIGSIGTHLLPESQLDRFMIRLTMGYPDRENEKDILKGKDEAEPLQMLEEVVNREEILFMQEEVKNVVMDDKIYDYLIDLVHETRVHEMVKLGISTRGAVALKSMVKATAYINNRNYVIPEDVLEVFMDVSIHRIILQNEARMNELSKEMILDEIINKVGMVKLS